MAPTVVLTIVNSFDADVTGEVATVRTPESGPMTERKWIQSGAESLSGANLTSSTSGYFSFPLHSDRSRSCVREQDIVGSDDEVNLNLSRDEIAQGPAVAYCSPDSKKGLVHSHFCLYALRKLSFGNARVCFTLIYDGLFAKCNNLTALCRVDSVHRSHHRVSRPISRRIGLR